MSTAFDTTKLRELAANTLAQSGPNVTGSASWFRSRAVELAQHMAELLDDHARLTSEIDAAADAIEYALERVGRDPEFAYHMLFTETLDRLIRASARISGRDPALVRNEIMERTRDLPQSQCQTDKEFIEGGGAHGDI